MVSAIDVKEQHAKYENSSPTTMQAVNEAFYAVVDVFKAPGLLRECLMRPKNSLPPFTTTTSGRNNARFWQFVSIGLRIPTYPVNRSYRP